MILRQMKHIGEKKNMKKLIRTSSRVTSLPTMLDAARSVSTFPGLSCLSVCSACMPEFMASSVIFGLLFAELLATRSERVFETVLTVRIALALRSSSVKATLVLPSIVRGSLSVSLLATSSASSSSVAFGLAAA